MRPSSRKRLWAVGVTLIAAVVGTTILFGRTDRDDSENEARKMTAGAAEIMAARTTSLFNAVDLALSRLQPEAPGGADSALVSRLGGPRRKQAADNVLDVKQLVSGVSAFAVFGANGAVLAAGPRTTPLPPPGAVQEALRFFAQGNDQEMFITVPYRASAVGAWSLVLARKRAGAHGAGGIVTAEMPLSYLEQVNESVAPATISLALLRRDGVVILHFPGQASETGRALPWDATWHSVVARGGGTIDTTGFFDKTTMYASIRPLDGLPVVVEAMCDRRDALAGRQRQLIVLNAIGACAVICIILLMRLLGNQLRLLEASEQALAGNVAQLQISNVHLDGARRQLDVVFSNISQGMCLFGANHRLIVCNRRYREIYHLPPGASEPGVALEEIVNHCYTIGAIGDNSRADLLASLLSTARSGEHRQSFLEMKDGRTIAIRQQPMPDGGWVATHEDVTEQRAAERKIAYLARHDTLTGLPNRALFEEEVKLALVTAARKATFAVLSLDLDGFKAINDTLGHHAGDELLRSVAARLQATVREMDTVARLGSDEFIVLQIGIDGPEDAARLAQRIIDVIGKPYKIDGEKAEIGVSIGLELSAQARLSAETLIKNADLALYIAKSDGRGVYRFFEPEMDAASQNRYKLERDLRDAVARDEFEVYYQPIIDLNSGKVCSYEALVRWNHPQRGMLQPADFITAAEECGAIVAIGCWVLRAACQQAAAWPTEITVAVNLSPIQFRASPLLTIVTDALAESGLAPNRLELEITERVLLATNDPGNSVLHRLQDLGTCITMDDFGTGYSSLSYLRRFPFDKVKIDGSFTADLTKRNDALFIVRAIAGLCRNMGIRVTAEGVETAEQRTIVIQEGCALAQGFYFGEPQPAHLLPVMRTARPETARPETGRPETARLNNR